MFGYIKPDKPELKIKEYETYKAVYCSVCKTLGKQYGLFSRFLLTYDAAFYVLVLKCALQNGCDNAAEGVCKFNPLKKCHYIPEDEILKQAAALTVIMFYYKLKDNISDSYFFKKIIYLFLLPFVKIKFKKAIKNYSYFNDIIKMSMEEQTLAEQDAHCSVDRACDPSAKALGKIFAYNITDEVTSRVLERIGYCIGRWVYLMDAFDDLEKDLKSGSFNPFIIKFELNKTLLNENKESIIDEISRSIRLTANEAAGAFDLINHKSYASVTENIIYDGMENELVLLIDKKRGVQ